MILINIYYSGKEGAAAGFAAEMQNSGLTDKIRAVPGNLGYEYFKPLNDKNTVLLIDKWQDQSSLDAHHNSATMEEIAKLRDKYDLHMRVERYIVEADENVTRSILKDKPWLHAF